ncbi:hypothetical protein [Methanoregula sp.]|uniref:hypothetical protein n=1 Tax=Methanoregula sp. TaxID=2052170 RepID=UPI0035656232
MSAVATPDTFFGNRGVITIDGASPVAVFKGIEITPKYDVAKLYGGGSILRQDLARHTFRVEVKIKAAKFDTIVGTSFMYSILNPTTNDGTVLDTNAVKTFTVVATATGALGTICKQTVTGVYFESIPMGLPENDWWTPEFSGEGSTCVFANS